MQLHGPLRLAGELGVQGLFNTVAPGQLVYVTDQLSNRRFLVDTGAAYSILPHNSYGQPTGPPLAHPDGCPLACWGDNVPAAVAQLLLDFPGVVNPSKQLLVEVHDVQHHIKTVGPPLASRFHRLEGAKLQAARAEFDQMEKDIIVRRSTSPWASPLHMVPKKDSSWQPCCDFRGLNLVTEPDRYPLPNMLDFANRLSGCTVFSKIDLRKGNQQVPVHHNDIPKTAAITPFGLYEFLDDLRVVSCSPEEHVTPEDPVSEAAAFWFGHQPGEVCFPRQRHRVPEPPHIGTRCCSSQL